MPTNLYGPGDNFDLESSHVLPAMIRKFHEAKTAAERGRPEGVKLWGTGSALREFLHVDDLARAACDLMIAGQSGLFNVGSGEELSVRELAGLVAKVVGYDGPVEWDSTRPNGTPRKLLDSSKVRATGWAPRISLSSGVKQTYDWYLENFEPAEA